jgi:uroporphyrinogen decarboxylase
MGVQAKLLKGMLYAKGLRFGELDGYERVIAGIFGRPDRPPIFLQPYTYAMSMHGLSSRRFFTEPAPFINASYNIAAYFGADNWSPTFDFYNIEAEAMGQKLVWRERSEPDVDTREPLVASRDDLKKLKPPVAGRSGRMPYVLESYKRYQEVTGIPPIAYACAPFTLAVLVRGYVNFVRDMRRDPAFAHTLLEFLSMEVVCPWIDRMAEVTNTSMVVMDDAWASAPNATTQMMREFCLPYTEKVIRTTNSAMRTVMGTGSWGEKEVADPREILDIKMEMLTAGNSLKALRPFYLLVWNEDYEVVGIPKIRAYAEEKGVCLLLNIRPDLIEEGPVERIVENVAKVIGEGAGDGRFGLLINLVPVGTPVEHVHAAVGAAKQFGTYPVGRLEPEDFRMPSFASFDEWVRKEGLKVE